MTAEKCVDCGDLTDMWTRGWDGEYRCPAHVHNGALRAMARHCPTCTCKADR